MSRCRTASITHARRLQNVTWRDGEGRASGTRECNRRCRRQAGEVERKGENAGPSIEADRMYC